MVEMQCLTFIGFYFIECSVLLFRSIQVTSVRLMGFSFIKKGYPHILYVCAFNCFESPIKDASTIFFLISSYQMTDFDFLFKNLCCKSKLS